MSSTKKLLFAAIMGTVACNSLNCTRTLALDPVYTNEIISVEHLSTQGNLDGFKMSKPAARKSADFWYFDTLNIVFFNSGEFAQYPHPLAVQVSGVCANGTDFYLEALADSGASLTNGLDGIFGEWKGIGTFQGSSLDKPGMTYTIALNSPAMGVSGNITLKATAPAHYPCILNGAVGANQNLLPGLYWSNAVPDADTSVDLRVGDTKMQFNDGVGYHDKNWGNKSIIDLKVPAGLTERSARIIRARVVMSPERADYRDRWYFKDATPSMRLAKERFRRDGLLLPFGHVPRYWDWGHGRLGPYSVVWYNLLDYSGKESRRSYVVKDGEVLLVSCSQDALVVRQKGGKAAWPPATGLLETEGIVVNYTLPSGDILAINVSTQLIVRDEKGAYQRANGLLSGGIVGGEQFEGHAHYEEFIYGIVNNITAPTI